MELYTSYFGNLKTLEKDKIKPIGIAVRPPAWFHGTSYLLLAPRYDMLRMPIKQYDVEFQKILKRLNINTVMDDLKRFSQGRRAALLCFEKDRNDCHRLQVAQWIEELTGMTVNEYGISLNTPVIQERLF